MAEYVEMWKIVNGGKLNIEMRNIINNESWPQWQKNKSVDMWNIVDDGNWPKWQKMQFVENVEKQSQTMKFAENVERESWIVIIDIKDVLPM